jgi:hypothetical protein
MMKLNITAPSMTTLSITTTRVMLNVVNAGCRLYYVVLLLSVVMLNVIMLSVVAPRQPFSNFKLASCVINGWMDGFYCSISATVTPGHDL